MVFLFSKKKQKRNDSSRISLNLSAKIAVNFKTQDIRLCSYKSIV